MHFVTVKRPEFVLFCMSPSERCALGLDERHVVHFFVRGPSRDWQLVRTWSSSDYSHTAFMASLRERDEPADPMELLQLLPATLR
jgi:hypothetical protein